MPNTPSILAGLTDEEILDEFVKRFQCDGAVLIYLDSRTEYGFARWSNSNGKKWVNELFTIAQNNLSFPNNGQEILEQEDSMEMAE
ncbi:MAG TPA: hypothetical protein VFI06_12805 [Chitinophagaceae bacterium]|nr:hypothetical protein [Chitinophagaceae bacterium]